MASVEDVEKLAALARIRIEEGALEKFSKEFDGILAYIGQLEELAISTDRTAAKPRVRNVFREDEGAHAPSLFTEALAEQFPERKGNYLSVKQIISHD